MTDEFILCGTENIVNSKEYNYPEKENHFVAYEDEKMLIE